MKRLSTFLLLAFLGITVAKAQSNELYVVGENDGTPGDAPTLYVSGGEDLYVQGGVVISSTNTRWRRTYKTLGTLHIGANDSSGTAVAGNWTNSTGASVYAYSQTSVPASTTYQPSATSGGIIYGLNSNTVSLEYGNQLITGNDTSAKTYFYNLSLLDSAVNRTTVHSYKTLVGASIYVGVNSFSQGILDLNDEYLNTQNFNVYVQNPSVLTSGTGVALSRIDDNGTPHLGNIAPFDDLTEGMVIASNIAMGEPNGRLVRYTNTSAPYFFPVGTLVNVPSPGTGQAYDLFRPAEITPSNPTTPKSFGVALAARDGFVDAGTALDQLFTPYNSLAGINHQSYYKINQFTGMLNSMEQITVTHLFSTNSEADLTPNWSTCGNLPASDFPQTITVAQYDNNGINLSWNDVCHNSRSATSKFSDVALTCGAVTVTPDSGFCNTTDTQTPPALNSTTTVAYQIPGAHYGQTNTNQDDYAVAGLFFTVDGGNGSCDGNCAALPLDITSLTGWNVPNQNENEVQWVTATEENIDFFWVEKSIDGINFTNISGDNGVAAHGTTNTQQTYNFFDKQPNIGDNYYRIQEFTYNNQSVMTNIINVPLNKAITIANI